MRLILLCKRVERCLRKRCSLYYIVVSFQLSSYPSNSLFYQSQTFLLNHAMPCMACLSLRGCYSLATAFGFVLFIHSSKISFFTRNIIIKTKRNNSKSKSNRYIILIFYLNEAWNRKKFIAHKYNQWPMK